jgi:hydroxypyruvate reductase
MSGGARPQFLVIAPIYAPALAALEAEFVVHRRVTSRDALPALLAPIPASFDPAQVRGLVTTGLRGFTAADLHSLPALEIIACFGQSHGTLDLDAARARGITVTNTPDWTEQAVADVALGLMLGVMRRLAEADRFVRAGRWHDGPFPMSTDLRGKTCGIVGMGAIGRAIARRAAAFDLAIAWHGPKAKPDAPGRFVPDLAALAVEADCLVIACALTADTRRSIDASVLAALGPTGFLVNVSRGGVVDQTALIAALASGGIAGAGLEVFENEPDVPAELRAMEQVMLVPHIGTSTREIRAHRQARLIGNLRAFFSGQPVLDPVG